MEYYYYYPYPPTPLYDTADLKQTFPSHHGLTENMRNRINALLHLNPDGEMHTPRADVRETQQKYYIDIELPGIPGKDGVTLVWTNRKTLFVKASVSRPHIPEPPEPTTVRDDSHVKKVESKEEHQKEDAPTGFSHLIVRERMIGLFERAFHFPTDMDHESLTATLESGVLQIIITKQEHEQVVGKKIEVKSTGQ
jgi:HSP20 family molecular chaperone IbpA